MIGSSYFGGGIGFEWFEWSIFFDSDSDTDPDGGQDGIPLKLTT